MRLGEQRASGNVADQLAPQRKTEVVPKGAPTDEMGQFISKVLGSTEDVWTGILASSNSSYSAPTLVLYEDTVRTACGTGQAVMGPFYCAEDETLSDSARKQEGPLVGPSCFLAVN